MGHGEDRVTTYALDQALICRSVGHSYQERRHSAKHAISTESRRLRYPQGPCNLCMT